MTPEELKQKIDEIEKQSALDKKAVIRQYCDEKNPYKLGDVFTDHIGSIKIDKMGYSYGNSFGPDRACMVYEGVELKKDGSPKKNNPRRMAWQSNDASKS